MRREQFCQLTAEDVEALKSKKRRGLLPFDIPDGRYVRADYSPWRAVIFNAYKAMASDSINAERCAEIFREFEQKLRTNAKTPLPGGPEGDFYVGYFEAEVGGKNAYHPLRGTLTHIQQQLDNWNLHAETKITDRGTVASIATINLSKIIRDTADKARELGIDLNEEYTLDAIADGPIEEE